MLLQVTFEQRETKHRVIVGKEYYEPYGLEPELVVERVFSFLLAKRVQRQTEGIAELKDCACTYILHQYTSPTRLGHCSQGLGIGAGY